MNHLDRRSLLKAAALSPLAALTPSSIFADKPSRKKLPVAGIASVYKNNSHADVIFGKILEGYNQKGGPGPDLQLVSLYVDQFPKSDMSRALAEKHGVRICKTIEEAVTLGTGKVPVAGVISVGEHGDYPYTKDTKQHMYPRRRFFNEIAAAFRKAGQVVPVFNDKHLSYRWDWAKEMYDTAVKMNIPFMAGSSVPVGWRVPQLAVPMGAEIEEAMAIGYGGLESYGYHAIEGLQCQVERRRGGESGVKSIRAVQGEEIFAAEKQGRWSRSLLEAALAVQPDAAKGKPEDRLGKGAGFYLIEYHDGLKATVAMANGLARQFGFAVKLRGRKEPLAFMYQLQDAKPYGHFAYLTHAIENMIHTGKPSYPVERTLLTTGIMDRVMHSLAEGGKRYTTPELKIGYEPVDWPYARTKDYAPPRV